MLRRALFAAGILLLLAPSLLSPLPARASEDAVHVVAAGETLSEIAARYGLDPAELAAANGVEDPDLIVVGQKLRIPGRPAEYEVVAGDTLSEIAERFGVSAAALAEANGIDDPALIVVGARLKIPPPPAAPRPAPAASPAPPKPPEAPAPAPVATPRPAETPKPAAPPGQPAIPDDSAEIVFFCLTGRMANGELVHHGAAAADWNVFPRGTRIFIEGFWEVTIKDRIGGPQGLRRIDVWVPDCNHSIRNVISIRKIKIL
jgi:LysM repeat protein